MSRYCSSEPAARVEPVKTRKKARIAIHLILRNVTKGRTTLQHSFCARQIIGGSILEKRIIPPPSDGGEGVNQKDQRNELRRSPAAVTTNDMSDPIIFQKGPMVQQTEPGTYWWCACGRSATQPFCDGSHTCARNFTV